MDKTIEQKLKNESLNWLIIGAVSGALVVGIGAFRAHGLKYLLTENGKLATFETAVDYHVFHTLAILLTAIIQINLDVSLKTSLIAFLIGIIIFSGSLYVLSITNIGWLGAITPFGGVGFIVGWALLALKLYREKL